MVSPVLKVASYQMAVIVAKYIYFFSVTACGFTSTCTRTFTWKIAHPVFDNCTTGTTNLGCNPATLPVWWCHGDGNQRNAARLPLSAWQARLFQMVAIESKSSRTWLPGVWIKHLYTNLQLVSHFRCFGIIMPRQYNYILPAKRKLLLTRHLPSPFGISTNSVRRL